MIFTFSSCPLPALSRSSKKLPETSQKHSETLPRISLELPRASLRCSGSSPEPPCEASEAHEAPGAPKGLPRPPRSSHEPPQDVPEALFCTFRSPWDLKKPMNSLRKTMIFTFASCPFPTLSRNPKRLSRDVPKHSDTIPRPSRELPRASLSHSRSSAGSVAPPFHSF